MVTFDDTGERKPSPKPFELVLKRLGVTPDQAIMVGDWAERDLKGARAVGMKTAFAQYGDSFGGQDISDADYILSDIKQLLEIVGE